jgi:hypothetical protein
MGMLTKVCSASKIIHTKLILDRSSIASMQTYLPNLKLQLESKVRFAHNTMAM